MNKTMERYRETNYHICYIEDLAILGVSDLRLSVTSLGDQLRSTLGSGERLSSQWQFNTLDHSAIRAGPVQVSHSVSV